MFDTLRHTINIKSVIIIVEVMNMKENYLKSLQMIKEFKIKNEKEYNKLHKHYLILSAESLKYISGTRSFTHIVRIAREV